MYINYCILITLYILNYACVYFLYLCQVRGVGEVGSHGVGQYIMSRYADQMCKCYYRAVSSFSLLCWVSHYY